MEADAKSRHAVRRGTPGEPGRGDRRHGLFRAGRARGVRGGGPRGAARRQPLEGRAPRGAGPAARPGGSRGGRRARECPRRARRCRRSRVSRRSDRRSTGLPTAGRRSSGPVPSSRSRTAARSSARTASFRPLAGRSGASAPRSSSPTSGRRSHAGHREIVLTGINVGTYDGGWSERGFRGAHTRSALTLAGLVRRILDETSVERIRISSIEPQHVDDELLRAWSDGAPRTLPHVHLPLQSGDDGVLRRMGRRYLSADYAAIVGRIRAALPGVAMHADAIVGFPTEDDDGLGAVASRSSARSISPGSTSSATRRGRARPRPAWPARSTSATKKRRAAELLAIAADARARWASRAMSARAADVLLEHRLDDGRWVGHAADHTLVAVSPLGDDATRDERPRARHRPRRRRGCRSRRARPRRRPHPVPLPARTHQPEPRLDAR